MTLASISLQNVSFSYPLFASTGQARKFPYRPAKMTQLALDHVSLEIPSGSRLAVIGANGAGKTTLLRVLSGIFKPTEGAIEINGSVSTFIDAGYGLDFNSTGRENIVTRGLLLGHDLKQCRLDAAEIEVFAQLGRFIDQPLRTYSMGMVARLVFTMATQWVSEILIIDEGLSSADASFQIRASERLGQALQSAKILVFASHNISLLEEHCSTAVICKKGQIQTFRSVREAANFYLL